MSYARLLDRRQDLTSFIFHFQNFVRLRGYTDLYNQASIANELHQFAMAPKAQELSM